MKRLVPSACLSLPIASGNTAFWFYFGMLISSVGSFAFNICLVAFMTKAGFDLLHISLILQRLVPIVVATLYGHRTDELPPRLTVVAAELGAALASFGPGSVD